MSRPDDFGRLEVVLKYETQGILSTFFKSLQPGELALVLMVLFPSRLCVVLLNGNKCLYPTGSKVEFQGPCGGFEYKANQLDEITVLVGGAGITPALQLARCLAHDSGDKTHLTLLYYSDSFQEILYYSELKQLEGQFFVIVFLIFILKLFL